MQTFGNMAVDKRSEFVRSPTGMLTSTSSPRTVVMTVRVREKARTIRPLGHLRVAIVTCFLLISYSFSYVLFTFLIFPVTCYSTWGCTGSYIDLKLSAYRNTRLFVSTLCQDFCQHETCMHLQTCPVKSLRAAKNISTAGR